MWLILIPILLCLVNICDSLQTSIQNNPAEASIFQYVLWFILVTIGDIMALIVIAGVCVAISDLFKFICRFIKKQSYSYNLSHYQDSLNSIKNIISVTIIGIILLFIPHNSNILLNIIVPNI